jgi:hypothetical protein
MLPVVWSTGAIAYNQDIFDRDGVPPPSAEWDHAEMLDLARKLTRPERGQYGMGIVHHYEFFLSLAFQNDGHVFDPLGARCLLAEPEAVEAARLMRQLGGCGPGEERAQPANLSRAFTEGRAAMMFCSSWGYKPLQRQCRFKLRFVPLPRGKLRVCYFEAHGYAARKGVLLEGVAGKMFRLIAEIENWPEYLGNHPAIPLHESLEADVDPEALQVYSEALSYGRTCLADIRPERRTEAHGQAISLLRPALKEMLRGETAVEKIMCVLRDNANNLIPSSHGVLFNKRR